MELDTFVNKTLMLLELERNAELEQAKDALEQCSPETAQARGRSLLNLRCADVEGGLMGRTLITLVSNKGGSGGTNSGGQGGAELPPHKFGPHDIVAIRPNKGPAETPPLTTGLVYRIREGAITVAVDEAPEEGLDVPLRLDKLANEVTYQRLKQTCEVLRKGTTAAPATGGRQVLPGLRLVDIVFGGREPARQEPPPTWSPVNPGLDTSQQAAVALALSSRDLALIHGPPGTGKTTAVVEVILQEMARGQRVLACAASNIAVDNLTERLAATAGRAKVVRVGHPARLLPQVLECSLEAHVLRSDNSSLARDCRKEIKQLNQRLAKLTSRERAERREVRAELRRLAKEEKQRQQAAVVEVMKAARVVCCTLSGVLHPDMNLQTFDLVVVDEAAQALEVATWTALLKAPRAVLAGDHLQLPPTVVSDAAAKQGLGNTLFERLQKSYGSTTSAMLTVQYRMNEAIMAWSSQELYEGKLTAHPSVAQHTLTDLPVTGGKAKEDKGARGKRGTKSAKVAAPSAAEPSDPNGARADLPVLLLIDSTGCGYDEEQEEEGDSKANSMEAKVVMAHVKKLVQAGVPAASVGVITPYNAQVALLRELRAASLPLAAVEVSSVDGFQGREKEAVVISMVRSNERGEVGFLSDQRRMNVAVTRARRHCALVCDASTVSSDPFLQRLVKYFETHGDYRSAEEYLADSGP